MQKKTLIGLFLFLTVMLLLTGTGATEAAGVKASAIEAGTLESSVNEKLTQANVTAFVDQYVEREMEAAHAPGLIINVVYQGEVLLARGYGLADLETGRPMTAQANLRAGSASKPVTSAAVLQLASQGLVDLNRPVSDYITDLTLEDQYGPAPTVAQLLTLKGGYPDTVVGSHTEKLSQWSPLGEYLAEKLPARVLPPGKVHSYNSWEHALLGYMMEQVTGLPYDQAIAQHLLQPLGMTASTYTQPLPTDILDNLAAGYNYIGDGYEAVPLDYVRLSPGIALVTTGDDMGRFMMALLNDGRLDGDQVLDPSVSQGLLNRQEAVHAYSRGRTYGLSEVNLGGRQAIYHDGNGIGFGNRMILVPEHELGIFLSVNHRALAPDISNTPAYRFMKELSTALLARYLPTSTETVPTVQPLADAADRAPSYEGHYRKAGISQEDFFKVEGLLDNVDVRDNGDGTITIGSTRYQEVDPLLFQSQTDPGFFVVFAEDQEGQVDLLTFGGTGSYKRVQWVESPNVQLALLAGMALVFLSAVVVVPFSRPRRWLVWVVSLLNLVFLGGVAVMMTQADLILFYKTIPLGVRLVLLLPLVGGALTLTLPLIVARLWRGEAAGWVKAHALLVTVAAFGFSWFVYYWHLHLL